MKELQLNEFDEFFRSVMERISGTAHDPFPWQRRLAHKWAETGFDGHDLWAEVVAIPTGLGKTIGVMSAWLWALANGLQKKKGGAQRVPLRFFHVIDRRAVVDQSYEVATAIQSVLAEAPAASAAAKMRDTLLCSGSDAPLRVAKMRGGIFQDDAWILDPTCPVVISTTVDQLGSALLFRKYLASAACAPLFAGLASCDALIALDEAHLSRPFMDMLEAIKTRHDKPLRSLVLVSLTATSQQEPTFTLGDADAQDRVVVKRTQKAKPTTLLTAKTHSDALKQIRRQVQEWTSEGHTRIAVVCNTVKYARRVFKELQKKREFDTLLLTGRSRPHDRDALVRQHSPDLCTSDRLTPREKPLVVVCTQCIEVGVDFDFDAMLSESAPLDALQQRAGRLGRGGHQECPFVILHVDSEKGDPVYGETPARVVAWLGSLAKLDFCWTKMHKARRRLSPTEEKALCAEVPGSPAISSDLFDLWMQSNPRPASDPSIAPFLHGYGRGTEVSVAWRADLLEKEDEDPGNQEHWAKIVELAPPTTGETVTVPLGDAVSFLAGDQGSDQTADVASTEKATPRRIRKPALIWRGTAEKSEVCTDPTQIRPGDLLVVPASYGGHDAYGWTGWGKRPKPVPDLQAVVDHGRFGWDSPSPKTRKRLRVRVHQGLLERRWEALSGAVARVMLEDDRASVIQLLEALENVELDAASTAMLGGTTNAALAKNWSPYPDGKGVVFTTVSDVGRDEEEGNESSRGRRAVSLSRHLQDVGAQVAKWAQALDLPPSLVKLLQVAGETHDEGKAEPRFQRMLGRVEPGELRAKSGSSSRKKLPRTVPVRWRHEFCSVEMLEVPEVRAILEKEGHDVDLLTHLVGTHHGYGRCFAPPCTDPNDGRFTHTMFHGVSVKVPSRSRHVEADAGWAEQFFKVMAKHGPWNVAFLETLLRLADWRASMDEARESDDETEGEGEDV